MENKVKESLVMTVPVFLAILRKELHWLEGFAYGLADKQEASARLMTMRNSILSNIKALETELGLLKPAIWESFTQVEKV